jgi:hypothetical protein
VESSSGSPILPGVPNVPIRRDEKTDSRTNKLSEVLSPGTILFLAAGPAAMSWHFVDAKVVEAEQPALQSGKTIFKGSSLVAR